MSYYANTQERSSFIAGLRSLADFLDGNLAVPVPRWTSVMVFPADSTDRKMRRAIDGIAALIGAEVDDQTSVHGHYTASRAFGPVEYRAVFIPASCRERQEV